VTFPSWLPILKVWRPLALAFGLSLKRSLTLPTPRSRTTTTSRCGGRTAWPAPSIAGQSTFGTTRTAAAGTAANAARCSRLRSARIFEDSPISFSKWLPAVWLILSARNGISSCEVARALKVTQKTVWFMLHRIRESLDERAYDRPFEGPVEADETFVGGDTKKMNRKRREKVSRECSGRDKAPIMAIMERNKEERKGKVRAWLVPFVEGSILKAKIRENVVEGADVYTDKATWYKGLSRDYVHETVDHRALEYVRDHVSTNSVESFFSVFKRTVKGRKSLRERSIFNATSKSKCSVLTSARATTVRASLRVSPRPKALGLLGKR
jgi:ISXO2-like transposase domain